MSKTIKNITREYPVLTLDLKKEKKVEYDLGIILACRNELSKGYRLLEINEPTKEGTSMSFVYCDTKEELVESNSVIVDMIYDFQKKYNGWDLSAILN